MSNKDLDKKNNPEETEQEDQKPTSAQQWFVLVATVVVFLIPMWVSNAMGLKGAEAIFKIELPGWGIEALIAALIYFIQKKKGNWK